MKRLRYGACAAVVAVMGAYVIAPVAQAETEAKGNVYIPLVTKSGKLTPAAVAGLKEAKGDKGKEEKPSPKVEDQSAPANKDSKKDTANTPPVKKASVFRGGATNGEKHDIDEFAILTDPIKIDKPFGVAAVTWKAGQSLPTSSEVEMRTLDGDTWSGWYELDAESKEGEKRAGTEFNVSGKSTAIQVRVSKGVGELPEDMRVDVSYSAEGGEKKAPADKKADVLPQKGSETAPAVPETDKQDELASKAAELSGMGAQGITAGKGTPQQRVLTQAPQLSAPSTGIVRPKMSNILQPRVFSRAEWGANEASTIWDPEYATFESMVIHHTAGTNNYSPGASAGLVRGIHGFHTITRGWGDIGYNFLIDKYGQVFEGRRGTLASPPAKMAVGAHSAGRNTGTMGVSVLGNFAPGVELTGKTAESLIKLVAWKFSVAGIDINGRSGLTIPDKNNSPRYRAGEAMPRVVGHRDVRQTSCPGNLYNYIDWVRGKAAQLIAAVQRNNPSGGAGNTGGARISGISRYYLTNSWGSKGEIVFDYGYQSDIPIVGDWDGDGKQTIGIRRQNVFHLRNDFKGGKADKVIVYGNPGDELFIGDWDGDGVDTLAVRRGNIFYVKNSISTGNADKVIVYGNPGDEVLVGDWNGDGKDTFAVRRGNVFYVKNDMNTGVADRVFVYGNPGDTVLAANNNGKATSLIVRRGNVYHILDWIRSAPADRVQYYGETTDQVLIGDWDGDGKQTLGVRR